MGKVKCAKWNVKCAKWNVQSLLVTPKYPLLTWIFLLEQLHLKNDFQKSGHSYICGLLFRRNWIYSNIWPYGHQCSMRTDELEMHIRRVIWRYGKTDQMWRHFGFHTVSFGDKPAGVFLDIVLRKVSIMFKHIDPSDAEKLNKDVDDVATEGTHEEVNRMAWVCVGGNNKFETDDTLSKGSLKIKAVVTSGELDLEKIAKLGKFVLSMGWDPSLDIEFINIWESESLIRILNMNNIAYTLISPLILPGIINCPMMCLALFRQLQFKQWLHKKIFLSLILLQAGTKIYL